MATVPSAVGDAAAAAGAPVAAFAAASSYSAGLAASWSMLPAWKASGWGRVVTGKGRDGLSQDGMGDTLSTGGAFGSI